MAGSRKPGKKKMREEGIEPTTAGSGIQCSTTELFPHHDFRPSPIQTYSIWSPHSMMHSRRCKQALRLHHIRTGPGACVGTRHGAPWRSPVSDSACDLAIHHLDVLMLPSVVLLEMYRQRELIEQVYVRRDHIGMAGCIRQCVAPIAQW